jgi:hypothetical protein
MLQYSESLKAEFQNLIATDSLIFDWVTSDATAGILYFNTFKNTLWATPTFWDAVQHHPDSDSSILDKLDHLLKQSHTPESVFNIDGVNGIQLNGTMKIFGGGEHNNVVVRFIPKKIIS